MDVARHCICEDEKKKEEPRKPPIQMKKKSTLYLSRHQSGEKKRRVLRTNHRDVNGGMSTTCPEAGFIYITGHIVLRSGGKKTVLYYVLCNISHMENYIHRAQVMKRK